MNRKASFGARRPIVPVAAEPAREVIRGVQMRQQRAFKSLALVGSRQLSEFPERRDPVSLVSEPRVAADGGLVRRVSSANG